MLTQTIIGRIGSDAKINTVNEDREAISFDVAHSEKYKKNGDMIESTDWVRCTKFVQTGKTKLSEYLKKGDIVAVTGKPSANAWIDKEGKAQASLELRVDNLEFIHSKKDN